MTKFIPACDFGKTLWKWCGLSVREVTAKIETLDTEQKQQTSINPT